MGVRRTPHTFTLTSNVTLSDFTWWACVHLTNCLRTEGYPRTEDCSWTCNHRTLNVYRIPLRGHFVMTGCDAELYNVPSFTIMEEQD